MLLLRKIYHLNISRETNSIKEWEDGIKINFRVWFNRWGEFMTERSFSYIKITNNGIISIRLPEALEGGGIESELEDRIFELLGLKKEEEIVSTTTLVQQNSIWIETVELIIMVQILQQILLDALLVIKIM
jgi:hypothetical protein